MSKTKSKRDVEILIKDDRYSVTYQGIMYPRSLIFKSEHPFFEKLELTFKNEYVGNIELFVNNIIRTGVKEDLLLDLFNVINKEISIATKIKKNVKLNIEIGQSTNCIRNHNSALPMICYPVTIKIDSLGKEYIFKYNIETSNILYKNIILDNCTSVPYQGFYNPYAHNGHQVSMCDKFVSLRLQKSIHKKINSKNIINTITPKQELINLLKEEINELENDPSIDISREDIYDIIGELFNFKDQLMK